MTSLPHSFDQHRTIWLGRYIHIALPMLVPLVIVQLSAIVIESTPSMQAALVIEIGYMSLVLWARSFLKRGKHLAAVLLCSGSLMIFSLVAAVTNPEGIPIIVQLPLLALLIAIPFLRGTRLIIALAGAFITTLGIVAMVGLRTPPQIGPVINLAVLVATGLCTSTIIITVIQYHRWFTDLLEASRAANAMLSQVRDQLEDQIQRRTSELAEREERYRMVSGLTSDLVMAYDVTDDAISGIAWATDSFTQITGYTLEQIQQARGAIRIEYPPDHALIEQQHQRLLAGEACVWDARIVTASGSLRWMRNYAQPIYGQDGHLMQILAAAQEITLQKQIEESIRRQAIQRSQLLEIAQQMLAGHSFEEICAQIGQSLQQLLPLDNAAIGLFDQEHGYRPSPGFMGLKGIAPLQSSQQLLSDHTDLLGSGLQQPRLLNYYQYAAGATLSPPSDTVEHLIVLPIHARGQGGMVMLLQRTSIAPFSQEEYDLAQIFASFFSLAVSNVALLEQYRGSEQKYRRLFEESTDVIYISTPEGRVLDINQAGLNLLGYTREEIQSVNVATSLYVDPDERKPFLERMATHGEVRGMTSRRRSKQGQIYIVEESARAIRNDQGQIVMFQGYIRDVTARTRAEAMVRQVVDGARCLLWSATVVRQPRSPRTAPQHAALTDPHNQHGLDTDYCWSFHFSNDASAARFLPVHQHPNQSYADAWTASRLPEDTEKANHLSHQAFTENWPGYSQEFRLRDMYGTIHWLAEDVQITRSGPETWELIGVCTDITDAKQNEARLNNQVVELQRHSAEIMTLNLMGETLQSARSDIEACHITGTVLQRLFPEHGGAIYLQITKDSLLRCIEQWGLLEHNPADLPLHSCWWDYARTIPANCQNCALTAAHPNRVIQCTPIYDRGAFAGLVVTASAQATLFDEHQHTLLKTAVRPLELAITNLRLRESLHHQAIRDPLTGLYNRRYMHDALTRELHRVQRHESELGILMLDLDFFKAINDQYGHATGDAFLRAVGQFLLSIVRTEDIACRYGGEEFLLILPDSTLENTHQRALEIGHAATQILVRQQDNVISNRTVSIGIAAYPWHGATGEALVHAADRALYQAKQQGRNRVVVADGVQKYQPEAAP